MHNNVFMKKVFDKMKNNPKLAFLLLLVIMEFVYWLKVDWYSLSSYFHNDIFDTFMDYFNMLWTVGTDHASLYETKVIYPAFCFLLWDILFSFMPNSVPKLSAFELRGNQYALFPFTILLIVITIFLWELLKRSYGRSNLENIVFALSMIMSGPILITIERGNIIFLAFVFTLVFGLYYNSEKKWLRYLAYIALAMSAAIKIYPALFGVLIISRKRWKEAVIAIILGVFIFVLPFIEFGGLSSIITLFDNILFASPVLADRGTGYNFSFMNLIKIVQVLSGNAVTGQAMMLRLIPICITVFVYLTSIEEWKRMMAIVLFCIWIPEFSYTYTLIFFILPFVFFLKINKKMEVIDSIYMLLFLVIFIPTATVSFPEVEIGAKYPLSGSVMITNAGIVAFSLLLVMEGVISTVKKIKKR